MKNNTKKITLDQWTMIGKYNYAVKWVRKACAYTLTKETDTKYRRDQYIPLWLYVVLFVPVCVVQAVWCMWDGGLKDFELPERYLGGDYLWSCDYDGLLEEIYGK